MAAKPLARLVAHAKPVDRKIFDEAAELERGLDVAEAIERGVVVGFSRRHEFGGGASAQIAEVDQRDARTVARAAKLIHRAGTADGEDWDRAEQTVVCSFKVRRVLALRADHDGPAARHRRQKRQLIRRRRQGECSLGYRAVEDGYGCAEGGKQYRRQGAARTVP